MNTALGRRLTPEQYEKLISAACARRKLVAAEQECQEWYLRRERYERIAAGWLDFRKSHNGVSLTIFDKINETLGIVQSVRRFLVARVCKDLFGSAPFFYVKPEGPADQDLALKLQKHVDWKLRLADYRNKIKESSSVLHHYVLEEIRDSLTPHLGYAIELIYKMQDKNETFDYLRIRGGAWGEALRGGLRWPESLKPPPLAPATDTEIYPHCAMDLFQSVECPAWGGSLRGADLRIRGGAWGEALRGGLRWPESLESPGACARDGYGDLSPLRHGSLPKRRVPHVGRLPPWRGSPNPRRRVGRGSARRAAMAGKA